jgi:aspartate-semialdehyde dehydrogenase
VVDDSSNTKMLGIVGASGVVGHELLNILIKNGYYDIKICGSDASVGNKIVCGDIVFCFELLNYEFFNGLDVVFFCADNEISKKWIPVALHREILVIDNSSYFRMNKDVPLIIPEINGHLINKSRLIANPNCCTAILCMALHPLIKKNKITRIDVSTYQAVSGAGKMGTKELELECAQFVHGLDEGIDVKFVNHTGVFKSQIFNNCFSHNSSIDLDSGYNDEELKIISETKKILDYDVAISATCIRVPIMRAHSESVKIVFDNPTTDDKIREILSKAEGITLIDDRKDNKFPEPCLATYNDNILVGRIRKDFCDTTNTVFHMFICGDQLLKGAALNAFQIFKKYKKYEKLMTTKNALEYQLKFISEHSYDWYHSMSISELVSILEKSYPKLVYRFSPTPSYTYLLDLPYYAWSDTSIRELKNTYDDTMVELAQYA